MFRSAVIRSSYEGEDEDEDESENEGEDEWEYDVSQSVPKQGSVSTIDSEDDWD